jgi:hypothetical protein
MKIIVISILLVMVLAVGSSGQVAISGIVGQEMVNDSTYVNTGTINEFRLFGDSLWQKIDSHGLILDDLVDRPNGGGGVFSDWVFVGVVMRTKTPIRRTLHTTTAVTIGKTERWR